MRLLCTRNSAECRIYAFNICVLITLTCVSPSINLFLSSKFIFLTFWCVSNYLLESSALIPAGPKLHSLFPPDDLPHLSPLKAFSSSPPFPVQVTASPPTQFALFPVDTQFLIQLLICLLHLPPNQFFFSSSSLLISLPEFSQNCCDLTILLLKTRKLPVDYKLSPNFLAQTGSL